MSSTTMKKRKTDLQKKIEKLCDMRTPLGDNLVSIVAPFAEEHPDSTEAHFLNVLQAAMAKARIRKLRTLESDFEEKPYSTEEKENSCNVCQSPIKYMRKIKFFANGKPLDLGETGNNIGEDCFDNITGLITGITGPDYEPRIIEKKEQREELERTVKATLSLDQLSKKIRKTLEQQGYDLTQRIHASIADDIQKQIARGDFTGLDKEIDPAKCMDVIDWIISHSHEITDKNIRRTIALLASNQHVSPEALHELVLYEWQTRLWTTSGELGGVKEDIHYLADLSRNNPKHRVIRRYGQVNLDEALTPIKVYDRATWEDITLRDVLGDTEEEKKNQTRQRNC